MKLVIDRASLLKSLSHVQNVVERRTTIPILSNVKLAAREGVLDLTATDMDLSVAAKDEARVEREGMTTVAAHTLFDIVRKLPEGSEVTIEQEPSASEVSIRAARSRFTLPALPADEFPAMDLEQLDVSFEIDATALKKLIDKTRFAISTEETRYYLNGIHIHTHKGEGEPSLRGVATDGHRLAKVEIELPPSAAAMSPIIVPRKTVGEVRKLIDAVDGTLTVAVSPKRIQFVVERAFLISRLIDGTFPDYERVIPRANDKIANLATKSFASAVDRVATISTERARAVKLSFESGRVVLSAVSADAGRASEELDVGYDGESIEIGFNARYILDMLGEIDGDEVTVEMASPAAPTLVRDPADDRILYVLMPMRV